MEKTNGSTGTMYWPGPFGALTETNLAGTINEEYVYFNGLRIARIDRPGGTVHYYFSNHLGSHTMVTNATGTCEQDIDYYPYGGVIADSCPVPRNTTSSPAKNAMPNPASITSARAMTHRAWADSP